MVNAEPERIFSVLKQIVTATRSSLSQAHIEQLMMIAMNSPDLSIFQKELLPLCIRFWMFLKNQATAYRQKVLEESSYKQKLKCLVAALKFDVSCRMEDF